jgi:hypothetical protein
MKLQSFDFKSYFLKNSGVQNLLVAPAKQWQSIQKAALLC